REAVAPEPEERQARLAEREAILAAGDLGPGEDDDVEDLREDEGRNREVDVTEPRREVGDEDRGATGGDQAIEHGEPEARRLHREKRGGRAVHAEAEERRMSERDHPGVADQDVG